MNSKNVMVCVTQQKTCERLILNGSKNIEDKNDKLFIIHIAGENQKFLNRSTDGEALEYLFKVSKDVGADLTVIRSNDVTSSIIEFVLENEINQLILGKPKKKSSLLYNLEENLSNIEITLL